MCRASAKKRCDIVSMLRVWCAFWVGNGWKVWISGLSLPPGLEQGCSWAFLGAEQNGRIIALVLVHFLLFLLCFFHFLFLLAFARSLFFIHTLKVRESLTPLSSLHLAQIVGFFGPFFWCGQSGTSHSELRSFYFVQSPPALA